MKPCYDVFELDARGHRRRCVGRDLELAAVPEPAAGARLEARDTARDGHSCHWDGAEWQPCPHPIRMARSSCPAGGLMSPAGRRRHYARAVGAARVLARSGITVAAVDAEGVTVVVHERGADPDGASWPDWCEARLAAARSGPRGAAREISMRWGELEAAVDRPDDGVASFHAAIYDVATGFRAAHEHPDDPPARRTHGAAPDLLHGAG